MAKMVNLRIRRKNLQRAQRQASAVQARAKSGRTPAERALDAADAEKSARHLDSHRLPEA
jgi:hypothetical protein